MEITNLTLVAKARTMLREFREKSRDAQLQIVRRFMRQTNYTYRVGTHESQKAPGESAAEAKDFMELVRAMVSEPNRHQDYVINMDQTPVPFTFNSKQTYEIIGNDKKG